MSQLDLLLSVASLGKLVRQRTPMSQPGPFTELFRRGGVEQADGDRHLFEKRRYDRQLAGVGTVDGESFLSRTATRRMVEQGLLHFTAHKRLTPKQLFWSSGLGLTMRANAASHIVDAVMEVKGAIHRAVEYVCARVPQDATININSANTAFPTDAVTISNAYSIDGSLQTQAAGAAWNIDSTRIVTGTNQLNTAIRQMEANGHRPYHVIHNRDVAADLVNNTEVQTWLTANGGLTIETFKRALIASAVKQGDNPEDFFTPATWSGIAGLPSWLNWDHGYENRSSTFTRYMDSDNVVLMPKDLPRVVGFVEGYSFIPEGLNVIGGAERAEQMWRAERGIQVYAVRDSDDIGSLKIVGRYTCAPLVRDEFGILTITGV